MHLTDTPKVCQCALNLGSSNLLVKPAKNMMVISKETIADTLPCMEQALAEEGKSGPAVHHALRCLELVHKSLRLALIPGESECGFHRIIVPLNPCYKTLEF